jgi:hypothetical protein
VAAFQVVEGTDELDDGRLLGLDSAFLELEDDPEGVVTLTLAGHDECIEVVFDAGAAKTLGLGLQVLGDRAEAGGGRVARGD